LKRPTLGVIFLESSNIPYGLMMFTQVGVAKRPKRLSLMGNYTCLVGVCILLIANSILEFNRRVWMVVRKYTRLFFTYVKRVSKHFNGLPTR
jgi:hypothetical protein